MFIEAGYNPSLFWELTFGEIKEIIDCFTKKIDKASEKSENDLRTSIVLNEVQSVQITERIASLFSSNVTLTPLHHFFPNLFQDNEEENSTLSIYKAKMDDYAFNHNERLRKAGEN